jgi:hypothetical protein
VPAFDGFVELAPEKSTIRACLLRLILVCALATVAIAATIASRRTHERLSEPRSVISRT